MTFTEVVVSFFILLLFISSVSSSARPLVDSVVESGIKKRQAYELNFVIESFRKHKGVKIQDFDDWKRMVLIIEDCEILSIEKVGESNNGILWMMKFMMGDREIEVYSEGLRI